MKRLFVLQNLCAAALLLCPLMGYAANTAAENQAGADRVARTLAENFPNADLSIRYQDGTVWIRGELASQAELNRVLDLTARIPNVQNIQSELVAKDELRIPTSLAPVPAPVVQVSGRMPSMLVQHAIPNAQTERESRVIQVPNHLADAASQKPLPVGYLKRKAGVMGEVEYTTAAPTAFHAGGAPMASPGMAGQYNMPNLPAHAWPSYAAYPNYAEVTYPRQHSRKAWPYIGPYYPYPKVPLEWRKVSMEYHDGWWWMDFDDGSTTGPFSPLFRQPNGMMLIR